MTGAPLGRRPGRSTSRDDILAAARELFAQLGYERATIRAIARRAKVDPALVMHHFGSKDELLSQALVFPANVDDVLAGVEGQPGDIGTNLVRRVLTAWENPMMRGAALTLLRTGLSHERAAVLLRRLIEHSVLAVVRRLAVDDQPHLRAALVGSAIAGLALGREVIGIPALVETPTEVLAQAIGPTLTRYLAGPLDGSS